MTANFQNQSNRFASYMVIEAIFVVLVVVVVLTNAQVLQFWSDAVEATEIRQAVFVENGEPETALVDYTVRPLARMESPDDLELSDQNGIDAVGPEQPDGKSVLESSGSIAAADGDDDQWTQVVEAEDGSPNLDVPEIESVAVVSQPQEFDEEIESFAPAEAENENHLTIQKNNDLAESVDEEPSLEIGEPSPSIWQGNSTDEQPFQTEATSTISTMVDENPVWWMFEIDNTLLPNRVPLRATLDEVVLVALQNSPQLKILNIQPAIKQTYVGEEISKINGSDKRRLRSKNQRGASRSRMRFDYQQPISNCSGKRSDTARMLMLDLEFDATCSQTIELTQRFVTDVVSAYWNVYSARVRLLQNRRSVARAEQLLQHLTSRIGSAAENETIQRAKAAIAARKPVSIRAEFELINAHDILNNLAMGPDAKNSARVELIPDSLNLPCKIVLSEERLVDVAIHNRPEIREAAARNQSAIVDQSVSEEAFSYTSFGFPVAKRTVDEQVRRSELQTVLRHTEYQKTMGDVILDVRIAAREVLRLNQEIESEFDSLKKASQELSLILRGLESESFNNNSETSNIANILDSQDRLSAAERRLLDVQCGQAVALVDLKRATGELMHSGQYGFLCSNTFSIPVQPFLRVPNIVQSLNSKKTPNDIDFVPAFHGVEVAIGDTGQRNSN